MKHNIAMSYPTKVSRHRHELLADTRPTGKVRDSMQPVSSPHVHGYGTPLHNGVASSPMVPVFAVTEVLMTVFTTCFATQPPSATAPRTALQRRYEATRDPETLPGLALERFLRLGRCARLFDDVLPVCDAAAAVQSVLQGASQTASPHHPHARSRGLDAMPPQQALPPHPRRYLVSFEAFCAVVEVWAVARHPGLHPAAATDAMTEAAFSAFVRDAGHMERLQRLFWCRQQVELGSAPVMRLVGEHKRLLRVLFRVHADAWVVDRYTPAPGTPAAHTRAIVGATTPAAAPVGPAAAAEGGHGDGDGDGDGEGEGEGDHHRVCRISVRGVARLLEHLGGTPTTLPYPVLQSLVDLVADPTKPLAFPAFADVLFLAALCMFATLPSAGDRPHQGRRTLPPRIRVLTFIERVHAFLRALPDATLHAATLSAAPQSSLSMGVGDVDMDDGDVGSSVGVAAATAADAAATPRGMKTPRRAATMSRVPAPMSMPPGSERSHNHGSGGAGVNSRSSPHHAPVVGDGWSNLENLFVQCHRDAARSGRVMLSLSAPVWDMGTFIVFCRQCRALCNQFSYVVGSALATAVVGCCGCMLVRSPGTAGLVCVS